METPKQPPGAVGALPCLRPGVLAQAVVVKEALLEFATLKRPAHKQTES
jgi:hypothetical protein